jgi:hypothetical protein
MLKKIFLSLIFVFGLYTNALCANTVTSLSSNGGCVISAIDSDWSWSSTFTSAVYNAGVQVLSVTFIPGAANDKAIFKWENNEGPNFIELESLDGEPRVEYFNNTKLKLYFDYDSSTISSGGRIIVIMPNLK